MVEIVEHATQARRLVGDGIGSTYSGVAGRGPVLECLREATDDRQWSPQVVSDIGQQLALGLASRTDFASHGIEGRAGLGDLARPTDRQGLGHLALGHVPGGIGETTERAGDRATEPQCQGDADDDQEQPGDGQGTNEVSCGLPCTLVRARKHEEWCRGVATGTDDGGHGVEHLTDALDLGGARGDLPAHEVARYLGNLREGAGGAFLGIEDVGVLSEREDD